MRASLCIAVFLCVAALAVGCAPKTYLNQSFLTSEELKTGSTGYVSLKSTGETMDLGGLLKEEPDARSLVLIKIHGVYIITGEGFKKIWRLWASGTDKGSFKPVKFNGITAPLESPSIEKSGECALVRWTFDKSEKQVWVTADGSTNIEKCPLE